MLKEIIEKSYVLFAKYYPTPPLDICTDCCMPPEDAAKLARLSVRQIPKDLLTDYNDGAKSKKTRIEEVKHFLPRYFDLVGQFEFPSHSAELSFSRLKPFDKDEWTKEELELLNQFSVEYFKHCLSQYPLPALHSSIDSILIMFWKAGFKLSTLLTLWENEQTKESVLHFRDLQFHGFDQYNRTKLFNAFGDKELAEILRSWVENQKVKQNITAIIERLILENNDLAGTDINDLNILYDIVRAEQESR